MLRWRTVRAGGVLALILLGFFGFSAQADNANLWLDNSILQLQKEAGLSAVPSSLNGNIDCQQSDSGGCVVGTTYGMVNSANEIQLSKIGQYYPVYTQIDNQQHFMPVPDSDIGISYSTSPQNGLYLYFNHNFYSSIQPVKVPVVGGTSWQYRISKPPDGRLQDQSGNLLAADYNSMSFSADGQWMVVTVPNIATVRVNLQTLEVLPFGPGFNYSVASAPAAQTAITNDGRYAVVASKNFGLFKLYDLSTCGPAPQQISGPVTCRSRDLQGFMQNQVPGFVNASNIRFISDDTLGFYATTSQNNVSTVAKYILNAGSGWHQQDYLSLGDSYISGEGAFGYLPGTDTDDNKCHVSQLSYTYLLGRDLDYNSYHSVACSGAITKDIIDTSPDYHGQSLQKIARKEYSSDQLSSIETNFQQGYIDQLDFVSQYQPKVITMSIGGNNVGFSSVLVSCLEPGTCYGNYEDRQELLQEIDGWFPKLVGTYQQVKNAGAPDARIYIMGYPQLAKTGGDCGDNVHLDAQEVEFSNQLISYLDSVIKAAAVKAGVGYVDTQSAFDGHRLCEAPSKYEAAVNGITAGNDRPSQLHGPIGAETYHPTALGYSLLARTILSATDNLTKPMPAADPASTPPDFTALPIMNVPKTGRPVNTTEYDDSISDDVIYKDAVGDLKVNGTDHGLTPGTDLSVELHSDAVQLGSFAADTKGNLFAQVTIPSSVPDGYHTLHLYGTDATGQAVDIYKTVYIADSFTDLDGNGIPDSQQECVGVASAGRDVDQDGIDDACDPVIGAAPVGPAGATPSSVINIATAAKSDSNSSLNVNSAGPKTLADVTAKPAAPQPAKNSSASANLRLPPGYLIGFAAALAATFVLAYFTRD